MYYVYILKSLKDKKTYTGFCKNVGDRLQEHDQGRVNATRHRRPLKIIFIEKVKDLKKAKKREKYWKSGAGRRKLKHFFKDGFPPIQKY